MLTLRPSTLFACVIRWPTVPTDMHRCVQTLRHKCRNQRVRDVCESSRDGRNRALFKIAWDAHCSQLGAAKPQHVLALSVSARLIQTTMQPPRLYSSLWLCAGLMGLFTCVNAAGYMDHTGSKRWHAPHVSPADHYGTVDTQHLLTFQPFSDLRALSDVEFTTLEHPLFPRHSVRVKKSQFCDGNAR